MAFANGDVKQAAEGEGGETVCYFYAAVDTWHVTDAASGCEVFHFPSGQVEAHAPDGTKDIRFPEGGCRRVYADGREEAGPSMPHR